MNNQPNFIPQSYTERAAAIQHNIDVAREQAMRTGKTVQVYIPPSTPDMRQHTPPAGVSGS